MKLNGLRAASASSSSSTSKPTETPASGTASQPPLTTTAFGGGARLEHLQDASMGTDTCGWYEGTAITCASSATCGSSGTIRACCVDEACSSSAFNTVCLPYGDYACPGGTIGPATKCCTDASSPACLTLFWPTATGASDRKSFSMVDSCVPASRAGQVIMVTTGPPAAPGPSAPQPSGSPPLLKPPAGTILEAILGVVVISVLVVISCLIITRKMHAARTAGLRADTSRSSVTVSALPGREGREPDVPLSTRPGVALAGSERKTDRPQDGRRRSEAAR